MSQSFKLGRKSLNNLKGVNPLLVSVVKHAITITKQDFSVFEGLRSGERQNLLYVQGRSKIDGITKLGRHQPSIQSGYGNAVDLVPYCDGELCWEWELMFPICDAVIASAHHFGTTIRWGGTWTEVTSLRS